MPQAHTREHAHALIDRMAPVQLSALVGLMEILLDPVTRSLIKAPFEDESISEEENRSAAASKAWLEHNEAISHEEILTQFGLSAEDFERMSQTPMKASGADW